MLVLVTGAALLSPAAPGRAATDGVAQDPEVRQAQAALEEARARLAQTQARLDDIAAQFETAREHVERVQGELEGADERVAASRQIADELAAAHRAEIRRAYMQPGREELLAPSAFLLSPDVESALHAAALLSQVADARADAARRAEVSSDRLATDVGTQQGISAGTVAALGDLEQLGGIFGEALQVAAAEVTTAEDGVDAAVEAAEERAAAAAFTGLLGIPAPVVRIATVNGQRQEMTCPLGQPNGFVDTWHAPRSGGRLHKGVDMFAAYGMPIIAAADGVVTRVWNNTLGGLSVDLVDGYGNRYYHAHLSAAYVVAGQVVAVGDLLGANGQSGNARFTPPHLHWQFHPGGGAAVNPTALAAALCR